MTYQSSFSRAEWALLADAPLAAAAAVALAEEGGGYQEAAAMISGWREAAREYGDSPLIAALAAEMDPEQRAQDEPPPEPLAAPPGFDAVCDEAVDLCIRAADLLEARFPADLAAYQAFVMHILNRVAHASSSAFLGGERVTRFERSVIREIAAALRYRG
jgi:hypothetical protein